MIKINLYKIFSYIFRTRRVWWYTSLARTKARFARTTIGGFWFGLSNLLSITALASVYGIVLKVDNFQSYLVYLGCGLVCWNAISTSIISAPNLFIINTNQILNTNTNYIFYTLEEWSFNLQSFSQSFLLVLIGLTFFQGNLFINLIKVGFLPLINIISFLYWFPVAIAVISLRYKDFYQLVPILMQLIFLLSPFLYEEKQLGNLAWIADYNPLYQLVACFRDSLITGELLLNKFIFIILFNLVGTYFSFLMIKKYKKIIPFLL